MKLKHGIVIIDNEYKYRFCKCGLTFGYVWDRNIPKCSECGLEYVKVEFES